MGFRCATIDIDKLAEQLNMNANDLRTSVRNARVGGFARLWSFEDKGNFGTGRVSVSARKDKNSDYETQFQDGFVCLSGGAYQKAKEMDIPENGVSIIILNCDVRNKYDDSKKKMYTNFYIYDFDTYNNSENNKQKANSKTESKKKPVPPVEDTETEVEDDELPF